MPPAYAECLRLVRDSDASRPFVVAQLGQSLDGRIALPSGESRWINNDAALDHLHRLRAAVDGVVVGIGTALADDPMLNVRRVAGRNPARVVIDPRGRLPATSRMLADDGSRRVLVTTTEGRRAAEARGIRGAEYIVIDRQSGRLSPEVIVEALATAGLRRLLVEGGAQTVSTFLECGVLDRLHVLVAPVLLGSGKNGLSFGPLEKLSEAPRPQTIIHVLAGGDVLFDCHLKSTERGA
ncbi:MAG: RibD family protein [Hyphomicrobiaceae bacterium]|nr:RibD family protein [Hyphomicrobiaceae bacterium]